MWPISPDRLLIFPDEVHVWSVLLNQADHVVDRLRKLLSLDEVERAERFYFDHLRRSFIVCHGVLRIVLGKYTNQQPQALMFQTGQRGKPFLVSAVSPKVTFNLSHSKDLALVAVALDREVGIDVEAMRNIENADHIAKRFFSPRESALFCSLPDELKKEAFINCWTRKEAYLKATGEGLYRSLDQFDVSFVPGEPAALTYVSDDPREIYRWTLKSLKPKDGYIGALVAEGQDWRMLCWQWSSDN